MIPINGRRARPFNSSWKTFPVVVFFVVFFFSNCHLIPKLLSKSGENSALILTLLLTGRELKKTSHFHSPTKGGCSWQSSCTFLQQMLFWKKGRRQLSPTLTLFSFRTWYTQLIYYAFAGRAGTLVSADEIWFPLWPAPKLPSSLANTNINSQPPTSEWNKYKYAVITFILLHS